MKQNLHKIIVVLCSVSIVAFITLFSNDILDILITPLPKNMQSCLSEKFGNDANAQASCTAIPAGGADSVAVWTSDGKLRESKMWSTGTWPAQNIGIGLSAPTAKLDIVGGYFRARQDSPDSNNPPTSGRGLEMISTAGQSFLQAFNRDTSAYQQLNINGSPIMMGGNGNVAIGSTSPGSTRFYVQDSDNLGTADIAQFFANNLTQGVGIGYNSIQAVGSNAAQDLGIFAKGTGNINLYNNVLLTGGDALYMDTGAWTGDAGATQGKIQYHNNNFYFNSGSSSTNLGIFRRGGSDVVTISNAGKYSGTAANAVNWWSTSHENQYYLVNNWNGTYWRITSNHPNGVSVQHATQADNANTVGGKTFTWSGQGGQPNWVWGGNDANGGTQMYVWNPSNFNVANATNATTATYAWNSGQSGGAYGAGYLRLGVYHTLNSNSNGWLYVGDQNGSVYGGRGIAADNFYVNTRMTATRIRTNSAGDPHLWIEDAGGQTRFALRTSDGVGHGMTWTANWKDLAENMHAGQGEKHEAGDLVMTDPQARNHVVKTQHPYEASAIGVISTNPGLLMNQDVLDKDARGNPISLAGRAPTKVSLENGDIKIGDPLTASSVPGVAMKATKAGRIVGYAMENYPYTEPQGDPKKDALDQKEYHTDFTVQANGKTFKAGKVSMFVNPGYFAGATPQVDSNLAKEVKTLKEETQKQNDIIHKQQKQLDALEERLKKLESK